MILRQLKAAERRSITAYDFEWRSEVESADRDSLHITLAGAYDERGYRWYTTLAAFLRGELTAPNSGRRYYAHFGGASDMVFLLKALMKGGYRIRAIFSSSSAIVVTIEKGRDRWQFIDSFWLMRVSLAKIGEWMGLPKLTMPKPDAPMSEQLTYNERDCELLYKAIKSFEETLLDRGGQLGVTAASTALDMFLRRYLERPIVNSGPLDEWARPAYVASRVEKYRDTCERALLYDINSSFPYSMTKPVPGNFLGYARTLSTSGLWIADCDVRVPEQDFPPLPFRSEDGRAYYPSGSMRARITSEDMLCGDFDVLKVHSVWRFEERLDMARYAEDFYQARLKGGFEAEVYKILLNSLYGKLAEREDKQILLVNPEDRPDPDCSEVLGPHTYLVDEVIDIPHSHVPISCMITARSRRYLREWLVKAKRHGRVYYCDTDSVICDAPLEHWPDKLGKLKHEAFIKRGRFIGAKFYAYEKENDDGTLATKVKAKGFSRKVSEGGDREALTFADFTALSEGKSMRIERMLRIKELLRREKGEYTPAVIRFDKRLQNPRPKRKPDGAGGSRAWTVQELKSPAS